ncbi:MAG: O-antigen ligase family protein [Candidatus Delongbacteria bacterium]
MGRVLSILLLAGGLLLAMALGLPLLIRLSEYLLTGEEKVYALVPLLGALGMAVYVLFLLARNRHRTLFYVFIVSLPLISTLHRRVELDVLGMEFYIETLLALLLCVYLWHARRIRGYRESTLFTLVLLSFLGALISALVNRTLNLPVAWSLVQEILLPFSLLIMTWSVIRDRRDLDALLHALLYSLLAFAVLSLAWVFVLDQTIGLDVGEVLSAQTRLSGGVRRFLVGAGFVNSEVGNRIFLLLMPVAVVLIHGRAFRRDNLLYYSIILLSTYFIIATEHRAALLGAALVFLIFLVFRRTRNVKLWMKLAVLFIAVFFLHNNIVEYLNRRILLDESIMIDGSAQKRFVMWSFALDLFKERPLFGIGPLQYLPAAMHTRAQAITPHNYYVTTLAEQGLVGLAAYLGIVGTIFARGLRNARRLLDPAMRRLNFGLLAGVFYYQFVLFFGGGRLTHNNSIYIHSLFWVVVAVLWILPRLQEVEARDAAALRGPAAAPPAGERAWSAPPAPGPGGGSPAGPAPGRPASPPLVADQGR